MARQYFPCYHSYQATLRRLSDAQVGRLFRALLRYSESGAAEPMSGPEALAYDFMTQDIDRARESYAETCAQNRRNGKRGGRPKKQPGEPADMAQTAPAQHPSAQTALGQAAPQPSSEQAAPPSPTPPSPAPGEQPGGAAAKNRAVFFDPSKTQGEGESEREGKGKGEGEGKGKSKGTDKKTAAAASAAAPPDASETGRSVTGSNPGRPAAAAATPALSAAPAGRTDPAAPAPSAAQPTPPSSAAPAPPEQEADGVGRAAAFFEQNGFGRAVPAIRDELRGLRRAGISEGLLITAMQEALDNGCPRWAYARKVLDRCRAQDITDTAGFAARGRPGFGRSARVDRPDPSRSSFLPHGRSRGIRLHQSGPVSPQAALPRETGGAEAPRSYHAEVSSVSSSFFASSSPGIPAADPACPPVGRSSSGSS